MAPWGTRWLLLLPLFQMPTCHLHSVAGPPPPPSVPRCHMLDTEHDNDIHCSWDPGVASQGRWNYSLHWRSHKYGDRWVAASSVSGVIQRSGFVDYSKLSVWVRVESEAGSSESPVDTFDVGHIRKPHYSPNITRHSDEPLEITWEWESGCGRRCEVQHRLQDRHTWTQEEEDLQASFLLPDAQPFSVYEFRVRCACEGLLVMSDWSEVQRVSSAEAAPVGLLDMWTDCGTTSDLSNCTLVWKELPHWKARGKVKGYLVSVAHAKGSLSVKNVSGAELAHPGFCWGGKCYLPLSLRDVSAVWVSMFNSKGATEAAHLALPKLGHPMQDIAFTVKRDGRSFNVSWVPPSQPRIFLEGFVVQHRQAGFPEAAAFDWTKLNGTETSAILTGDFEDYTAYQVSLFAFFNNSSWLLKSTLAFTREGTPPNVPEFRVQQIDDTSVTLTWKHIPLQKRRGFVLAYLLGQGNHTEFQVKGDKCSFLYPGLKPGQRYEVWIRAETAAGPGGRERVHFSTKDQQSHGLLLLLFLLLVLAFFPVVLLVTRLRSGDSLSLACCFEKVPDPMNSQLFKQVALQFNTSWSEFCSPSESNLKLSQLEIIEVDEHGGTGKTGTDRTKDDEEGIVRDEYEWPEPRSRGGTGAEDYSKVMDSDETDGEQTDASGDSADERQCFSDYEKHFMPTPQEL